MLIGLFKLLNTVFLKAVNEQAKETPKERICVVPTHRKPKPNKSGHSLVPLSAHILSYGSPCLVKGKHSSLPYPLTPTLPAFTVVLQFSFLTPISYFV